MNVITSIELIQAQTVNKQFKQVLGTIINDIRSGHKLSESMSRHPDVFPSLFCRSLSVGEQSGELAKVLDQAADYMEKTLNTKKGLKGALAYPAFMAGVALVVIFVLVNFVFPVFTGLYDSMGVKVPSRPGLMFRLSALPN